MSGITSTPPIGPRMLLVLSLCVTPAAAQSEVRPYPDPGHRWLEVYAGGPEQHFDYFLRKIGLGNTFPDKAAWWEGLKKERSAQDGPHRPDVFIVYCGEKAGNLENARLRIDAWLKPEPDCYADAPNLGGNVTLSVAPRQGQLRWSVTSQGRHDGPLTLKVPPEELAGLQEFDIHVLLSRSSGVEQEDKACARLRGIRVQAK